MQASKEGSTQCCCEGEHRIPQSYDHTSKFFAEFSTAVLCHMFSACIQVLIGTGCLTFTAFTLEYGGPFDCRPVRFIIAGCGCLVFVVILCVVLWCRTRNQRIRRLNEAKQRYPFIRSVYPNQVNLIGSIVWRFHSAGIEQTWI